MFKALHGLAVSYTVYYSIADPLQGRLSVKVLLTVTKSQFKTEAKMILFAAKVHKCLSDVNFVAAYSQT